MGNAGALNGPDYKITEDLGSRAGSNLFHSFGQFNLNNTESATFSGSTGINNVIGRVTGGQASNIDGTLRVSIPEANLYLLNPAGIIFGPNAKLNVPGSFHASTADILKFQDGTQLNSGETSVNPILTTAAPEAFGFLVDHAASISLTGGNNTVLEVDNGKTLSLIAGDISIKDASLYAPGGQVNLVSVASTGEVGISETGLDTASFEKMGNIDLSQDPLMPRVTIENNITLANIDVSADAAGRVFIRGGQMVMENAKIESQTINHDGGRIDIGLTDALSITGVFEMLESGIKTVTNGEGNTDGININTGTIDIYNNAIIANITNDKGNSGNAYISTDTLKIHNVAGIISTATKTAEGQSGNLTIAAKNTINMYDTAFISNNTSGKGNAGYLHIKTDSLTISESFINTTIDGSGTGGDLLIKTNNLEAFNRALISSSVFKNASNKGGNIDIEATGTISLTGPLGGILSQSHGRGNSGALTITSDKLHVRNGAEISSSISSSGNSGDLLIKANEIVLTNDIEVYSENILTGIKAKIFDLNENGTATGNSGNLIVKADNLIISNGAKISTSNLGQGNSGDLLVDSNTILLTNEEQFLAANPLSGAGIEAERSFGFTGNSGDLIVNADDLLVENGTEISTSNFGEDNANSGNLLVNSDNITLSGNGSSLRTGIYNTNFKAGNLGILAVNSKNLHINSGAGIGARTQAAGNGGNLAITTDLLEMYDGAKVDVSTAGTGQAGNLIIEADNILLDNATLQSASFLENNNISDDSKTAMSGNIKITIHDKLHLENKAAISVRTETANAGNVSIEGEGILKLSNGSEITTSAANGQGRGGDISLATPIVVLDGSFIKARAFKGIAGNITISGFLFKSPLSDVDASSELSMDGEVTLKPDSNISGSITKLPDTLMDKSNQLSERCAARSQTNSSSFVIKGNDKRSYKPGDLDPSNFNDYSGVKSISFQNPDKRDISFSSLENNYQLPMVGGCGE